MRGILGRVVLTKQVNSAVYQKLHTSYSQSARRPPGISICISHSRIESAACVRRYTGYLYSLVNLDRHARLHARQNASGYTPATRVVMFGETKDFVQDLVQGIWNQ